ncbi:MAG: hypothetical protein COY74_00175 [Nitrosopumilales archaeon CG_4_10_14_0_8_um_filter_34_8]|nr:MAG: hypothetical protein COY74_00175 [Nitrosopumilales archaeon CG_4_10_14_0_8_um_filter_34_8]PJB96861.1 MAG: hypothetical protein CO079_08955 [Nitrosopumilales archaeon CG_4_9_14_0_8_um_filter_34_10]
MDLLIGLVMVTFIIAAVFVGYHASQESYEMAEGHSELIELNTLSQVKQESYMKLEFNGSIQ